MEILFTTYDEAKEILKKENNDILYFSPCNHCAYLSIDGIGCIKDPIQSCFGGLYMRRRENKLHFNIIIL